MSTASTGRTHDCTRPPCTNVKTTLANREPSTHDPFSDIGCTRALARSGLPDATDSNLKVVSFVGAGHRGVDWMAEPCGSCELREIDWAVPLPGPGAGRRRRVDGSRLRQITGTSADRRVGGGRGGGHVSPSLCRRPGDPARGAADPWAGERRSSNSFRRQCPAAHRGSEAAWPAGWRT